MSKGAFLVSQRRSQPELTSGISGLPSFPHLPVPHVDKEAVSSGGGGAKSQLAFESLPSQATYEPDDSDPRRDPRA